MLLTLVESVAGPHSLRQVEWHDFAQLVTRHEFHYPAKMAAPLISPAEFYPGQRRTKDNVRFVHFGLIDIDGVETDKVLRLLARLKQAGECFAFYTSWSHPESIPLGKVRGRLIVPFTEPVSAHDWPATWKRLQQHTDHLGDPSCKDASRGYFVPSAPAGTEHLAHAVYNPGLPFAVHGERRTESDQPAPVIPAQTKRITVRMLQDLSDRSKSSRSAHRIWFRDTLRRLIGGEPLSPDGERNNTTYKLVACLLDEWPDLEPGSVADLFEPSLQAMRLEAPDAPTRAQVLDQVNRKQHDKAQLEANSEAKELEEKKRSIRLAFELETGRDWPYTAQELEGFAQNLGVQVKDLHSFWIIQKHTGFYVYCAGNYKGPFTQVELEKAAHQWLAPACSAGVELYHVNKFGEKHPKDWQQLMRDYGTLAEQVYIDLTAQRSTFDRKLHRLIEAPCPLRPLTPTYDPWVARWLELLAGEQLPKLKDWLAVVTLLSEPCAAIYLEGIKGCGKSMLADGVARLWTERSPIPMADVMGNAFNSLVIECPLVFADESMPRDSRGKTRSGEFRQIIQARHHTLKRKYIADATIKGSLRFIMAANNSALMDSNEYLTPDDISAITDRVLHIDATQAYPARDYLNSIPKHYRNAFVHGDIIARHCLWLRDNHVVDKEHRFLVSGDRTRLHSRLTTSSGARSMVCKWLISYLLDPRQLDSTRELLVRVYGGQLLVNIRGLLKHWTLYEQYVDPPETSILSGALIGLSTGTGGKKQRHAGDNKVTSYWTIDTANLVAWAEGNGFATAEALADALKTDTSIKHR